MIYDSADKSIEIERINLVKVKNQEAERLFKIVSDYDFALRKMDKLNEYYVFLNSQGEKIRDKFSLGGRWLRGFNNYGAGPRNSRTSYVGGNNLIVAKFDYSREVLKNTDFPLLLNLFNDYGLLWDNKTTPTNNDNSLRASAGFGIKYYSPIGPIGFSWGFPIMDEEYDINRMFSFSVGNLD